MYHLFGFSTQNTKKVVYILEELQCPYEYLNVDLLTQKNREPDFLALNPFGKVPVLKIDDELALFESGAICRYIANTHGTHLYPADGTQRAVVDQWLDFFSCHLGRWLNTLFFEKVMKQKAGMGAANTTKCEEAETFAQRQLKVINSQIGSKGFIAGEQLSIADFFAFAYIEQTSACAFPLDAYPEVKTWLSTMESRDGIIKARKTFTF